MVFFSACQSSLDDHAANEELLADAESTASVSIEDFGYLRSPEGHRFVRGKLVNSSSRHVRNAQIQVILYDEYNRSSGSMLVLVRDIEAGSDKSFQATVDLDDAAGARVRAIMTQ